MKQAWPHPKVVAPASSQLPRRPRLDLGSVIVTEGGGDRPQIDSDYSQGIRTLRV
jgi:hypothetical protein